MAKKLKETKEKKNKKDVDGRYPLINVSVKQSQADANKLTIEERILRLEIAQGIVEKETP